jgi:hypothetical protein
MTNPENPNVISPYRNPFRGVSNRDYRGQALPSPFGAEAKEYREAEHALNWLRSLPNGGHLERWDESAKKYVTIETVETVETKVVKNAGR